jgi:hypothetical protein
VGIGVGVPKLGGVGVGVGCGLMLDLLGFTPPHPARPRPHRMNDVTSQKTSGLPYVSIATPSSERMS